jgi:hypothetical protein
VSSAYDAISSPSSAPSPYDAISVPANSNAAPKAGKPPPNTYADIIKSAAAGLGTIPGQILGLPGDIENLSRRGMQYLTDMLPDKMAAMARAGLQAPTGHPDSAAIDQDVQGVTGQFHQPETTAGSYARSIASFLPTAAAPGGIAARLARPFLSGGASEAAGEAAQGTGLEPYARAAGAVAGGGIPSIAGAGMRIANKGAEALTGSGFLNPNIEAAKRLTGAFSADGGLDTALGRSASFESSGASTPSVLDLGGGNVRRLVRAAAGGGDEAHNVATTYADRVRANLQDNVISRAGELTPGDARTAGQAATDLQTAQGNLATDQYRVPYLQRATITPEMVDALQGPEGRRAIGSAYADASANRDVQQMKELDELKKAAIDQDAGINAQTGKPRLMRDVLSDLSAGSLDRVRIAMRDIGGNFAAKGMGSRARGYLGRRDDIDTALDQTPGLTDARASYRQMQASRDSVDAGATVLTSPSANYAAQISDLASVGGPPNLRPLQVGARQAITDAVESPAQGSTGVLTRLGTSNRATANLGATFGAERAGQFQEAVRNEVSRLRNANFISPETGSQTQLRGMDEGLVGGIPTSIGSFVSKIADKVLRGTQLTGAEREAIVRLGTSEADVRRFAQQAPSAVARTATPLANINSSRAQGQ